MPQRACFCLLLINLLCEAAVTAFLQVPQCLNCVTVCRALWCADTLGSLNMSVRDSLRQAAPELGTVSRMPSATCRWIRQKFDGDRRGRLALGWKPCTESPGYLHWLYIPSPVAGMSTFFCIWIKVSFYGDRSDLEEVIFISVCIPYMYHNKQWAIRGRKKKFTSAI